MTIQHTGGETVIILAFQARGGGSTPSQCSFFYILYSSQALTVTYIQSKTWRALLGHRKGIGLVVTGNSRVFPPLATFPVLVEETTEEEK